MYPINVKEETNANPLMAATPLLAATAPKAAIHTTAATHPMAATHSKALPIKEPENTVGFFKLLKFATPN